MSFFTCMLNIVDSVPLYQQIYYAVIEEIKKGSLKAQQKMPSKRALAQHLGVSINTIESAYNQLSAEGYIYSEPRRGFFVCSIQQDFNTFHTQKLTINNKDDNKILVTKNSINQYDLLSSSIDYSSFPKSVIKSLYRDVLSENKDIFSKGDTCGDIEFRQSIAKYLSSSRGVSCTAEQVIIGAGTEYLIQLLQKLFDKKTVFAVENPGYHRIAKILMDGGSCVSPISVDEYGMSVSELEMSHVSQAECAAVCISPSHQFPLGITMPIARRMDFLKWISQGEKRYIIEDDYDSEYRFSGKPIPSLQGLDNTNKVIYLGTFSRSLAPSIRISYMVLPYHLLPVFREKLGIYSCTVSRIEQAVLNRFISLGHFERHLNRMRTLYKYRRDFLVKKLLQHIPQIIIHGVNAGLHITIALQACKNKSSLSERALIDKAAQEGICIYGISSYYIGEHKNMYLNQDSVQFVIGYSHLKEQEMEEVVIRLEKAWKAYI